MTFKVETIRGEILWINPSKYKEVRLDGNVLLLYNMNGKIMSYTLTDKSIDEIKK